MNTLDVRWLGRIGYREAWQVQEELAALRARDAIPNTLLLLEHPPTITLGRRARPEHLLATAAELDALGIEVIESNRGGDVTYHGPGQLVGYAIVHLQQLPFIPDLRRYVGGLEQTLIETLTAFGIEAGRFAGYPGVWTPPPDANPRSPHPTRKIAAIGVKVSRWITQHGFALNVAPDLSHFAHIVPCGIHDYGVTSMAAELGCSPTLEAVCPHVEAAFRRVFMLQ